MIDEEYRIKQISNGFVVTADQTDTRLGDTLEAGVYCADYEVALKVLIERLQKKLGGTP